MSIGHLLNREVEIWRTQREPDGAGGWVQTRVFSHRLEARISRASVRERAFARSEVGDMQGAAELTHILYFDDGSDILRGDRVRDPAFNDEEYRVIGTQRATNPDVYIRAEAELLQPELTQEEVGS